MPPATLDLMAVQRFTAELNDRLRRCDNGEGMICVSLDESINYYVQLCAELRTYVNQWARAIFTGQVAFDQAVEDLLKEERDKPKPPKLYFFCFDEVNVSSAKLTIASTQGELIGKKGDAFRLTLSQIGDTELKITRKIEARPLKIPGTRNR
jgi:hypothetical protein